MSDRYASASRAAGRAAPPATTEALTPGKATLAQRLVARGLSREQVLALIEQATSRAGASPPAAVAAQSALGTPLQLQRGPAADALTEAAGEPIVVADEHVVVGRSIDPTSAEGTATIANAITAAPAGHMTAKLAVPGEGGSSKRATPPWPNGPKTNYKANQAVPFADYLAWVREVEKVYGVGGDAVQRMRRLHYSEPTKGAGGLFDSFLATGKDTLPTSPPLAQGTLDRLYEAGAVVTPQGHAVDLSHVFVLFDLYIGGTSLAGSAANLVTPLAGLFTWTGDLGSWFQAWLAGRAWLREGSGEVGGEMPGEGGGEGGEGGEGGGEAGEGEGGGIGDRVRHIFDSPRTPETWQQKLDRLDKAKDRCKKDDLIGNMDAHAMGAAAPQVAAGTQSMVALLEQYYGAGAAGGENRRFHRFVATAVPAIPHAIVNSNPLTVQLAGTAQATIYDILWNAVRSLRKAPIDPLEGQDAILQVIAQRFTTFLRTGLATGDAPW